MQALTRDWGAMHVRLTEGDGAPIVFLNSLGTDLRMWDAVIARLPACGPALRMDKRGHGLSATAPRGYGIPDLAQDVLAAMDHSGLSRATLVGCSIGGLIAQHVALMAPERIGGLVLSNTAPKLGTAEVWRARIEGVRARGMAGMADEILPRWFGPDTLAAPEAALWRTMLARTDADGYVATCEAIAAADITDRVTGIDRPALVIGGRHDLTTPPETVEALAAALPWADLTVFERSGHLPAIEEPEAFARAVTQFIERTSS